MTLKIIKCEQSSIDCFLRKVTEEGFGTITSIENCKKNRKTSIVLGKMIKFIDTNPVDKRVTILVREVLPDGSYGVKFKAVIQGCLSQLVIDAALHTGDRLGFFEPCIFKNPAFQPQEDIELILQIGGNNQSVMWYAKKQYILAIPPKSKCTGEQIQEKEMCTREIKTNENKVIQSTNSNKNKSPDTNQKPQIQPPVNPQSPSITPRYSYKSLAAVKSGALQGDLRRVNIIAVVSEISKGLSKTSTGKFTIICKLVDDSVAANGELINFDLHFFTPESTIISQIEQGDILRLHRVKMESYLNDVDGRIFNSNDVVLFKKNSPVSRPLSISKKLTLSDEEKRIVLYLKNWYKEKYGTFLDSVLKDITLLSSIKDDGEYNLVCKVVSQPVVTMTKITLCVSDGSLMESRGPRPSCRTPANYDLPGSSEHLVTDIEVFERLDVYSKLKVNDYVFLRSVKATKTDQIHLSIQTFSFPMVLEFKVDRVLEVESRLQGAHRSHNKKETRLNENEKVPGEIQQMQGVPPSNDKADSSIKTQVVSHHSSEGKVTAENNKTKSEHSSVMGLQSAVVKLVRLTDETCIDVKSKQQKSKRKKSTDEMKFDVLDENLEDASTVVNLTLEDQENQFEKRQRKKRLRLDSDSAALLKDYIGNDNVSREPQRITHKVSSWLTQHGEKDAEDLELLAVRKLMFNSDNQETDNLSFFISSYVKRLHVFLLQVVPDPTKNPLDLISGHCCDGCQQLYLYSTIHWEDVDNQLLPFCPSCKKTQLNKKLVLIFMLQLNVMDRNGNQESALVCREHGETFFGCSVKEFVMDLAVRRSRVQLLLDNTVFQSSRSRPFTSPLLDLSLVAVSDVLCVINSKLKLPPDP